MSKSNLPYNPEELPRELNPYYIAASDSEIEEMLNILGHKKLDDVFEYLPDSIKFEKAPDLGPALEYSQLVEHMEKLASKNNIVPSFVGDGLQAFRAAETTAPICEIRGLTTAYTPYQPERSQGTLMTLWLYSSAVSQLTGFEAVNSSLYDRATGLFEALLTAKRIQKKGHTALVAQSIYPGDFEVLDTLVQGTDLNIVRIPINPKTGLMDLDIVKTLALELKEELIAIAYPQINHLGLLEDVHGLTDLAHELKVQSVAIIDPLLISTDALAPPVQFGTVSNGCSMFISEGQSLCIDANFGGPGLGVFGIRYNPENKLAIRSSAGRYVGKAQDSLGQDCLSMVLSTREQHIRREKATSNICSNQGFVASLAGAGLLNRGAKGLKELSDFCRSQTLNATHSLLQYEGVKLAFPDSPFFNSITLELPCNSSDLIQKAREFGLHLGVDVSNRVEEGRQLIQLNFTDKQDRDDLTLLNDFFKSQFSEESNEVTIPAIPKSYLRQGDASLPQFQTKTLVDYYKKLGQQNVSPDDNIYPLGSCTMKYNPYINDYAASLSGFTNTHPQAPLEDCQGNLEILFETQEMFKKITGLPGVTTQPVAGAQGELVGIKMFQAYHRDHGNQDVKKIILIPRSAHGTNPATAAVAGFNSKMVEGVKYGIITIEANQSGQIDMPQLKNVVKEYGERIAGIMVTNPNTSGIFEDNFKEMADLIHSVDGLVYMDGANMNAIAGWVDLDRLGVDAVHNNLHKTWTIPHGGGGPGDAIVAVSKKLVQYLPGIQVNKEDDGRFNSFRPSKSIGQFHRHHGNFAHKVRCYTYLKALGTEGLRKMSAVAVLSAQYLFHR
ncbi:MAG: glycine dehydrogenase, partial [Halobacteriovoraceae bacterium]|nr:glycine dehydrogenase [Halobacteriovoraceae bacterium]